MSDGDRSLVRELAHELRDALSPLASSADLARLRRFDPEASRMLAEKVERGLRRALAILDSFVLAEQSEDGGLQLAPRLIPLDQILQAGRSALGEEQAGRYQWIPGAESEVVCADAERSAQVLAAVLQYAGTTALRDSAVEVRTVGGAQPQIRVRSRFDPVTGPGEHWFASYRGGAGRMALRTARRIMMLQGGGLDLASCDGDGWEFVIGFAGERARAEPQRQETQPQVAELPRRNAPGEARAERILIVDDSQEVRRAYREALVTLGYTVVEAADAEQALSALEATVPDVALIDIHLPRMNGYRLAQAIRARAGAAIHLVMLSGMALDEVTRGLAQEAGFDDCLDKMAGPIALRELLAAGKRNSLGNDEK